MRSLKIARQSEEMIRIAFIDHFTSFRGEGYDPKVQILIHAGDRGTDSFSDALFLFCRDPWNVICSLKRTRR